MVVEFEKSVCANYVERSKRCDRDRNNIFNQGRGDVTKMHVPKNKVTEAVKAPNLATKPSEKQPIYEHIIVLNG